MQYHVKKPGTWGWTPIITASLAAEVAAGRVGRDWALKGDDHRPDSSVGRYLDSLPKEAPPPEASKSQVVSAIPRERYPAPVLSTRITISDIDIPFTRMVAFMVKWSFAAIPAIIIVWLIVAAVIGLFGGLLLTHH